VCVCVFVSVSVFGVFPTFYPNDFL
jgi:hypothetical protein